MLENKIIVVDIGAYGGVHPDWKKIGKGIDIYGFEPHEDECVRLNALAAQSNEQLQIKYFPYAISGHGGEQSFHLTMGPTCASLRAPDSDEFRKFGVPGTSRHTRGDVKDIIQIQTVTLDDFCNKYKISPDCIKIDTQGTEYEILKDGFSKGLKNLLVLETEVEFIPLYKDQKLFSELELMLREQGFQFIGLKRNHMKRHNGVHCARGAGGQLIHGDALFFNSKALLGGLEKSQAAKAALLADRYGLRDLRDVILAQHNISEYDYKKIRSEISVPVDLLAMLKKLASLKMIKAMILPHKGRGEIVQFDDYYGMRFDIPFFSRRFEKLR